MAHHKRHRPKSRRAGCLMCKGWKLERGKNGNKASYRGRRKPAPTTPQWRSARDIQE